MCASFVGAGVAGCVVHDGTRYFCHKNKVPGERVSAGLFTLPKYALAVAGPFDIKWGANGRGHGVGCDPCKTVCVDGTGDTEWCQTMVPGNCTVSSLHLERARGNVGGVVHKDRRPQGQETQEQGPWVGQGHTCFHGPGHGRGGCRGWLWQ